MATTTTNFGWDIPQSTDLVKDGATAIATLGQDIDTSMVDLKGGTTGQVLSKASNTDMDFTWVAQDDSNAIQNAIVDAKGDLITATAADTPARLAVGTNKFTLVADSAEPTGLKWKARTDFIGCSLYDSGSTQTIANNTVTSVTFDSELIDTDGFHSTSSNTSRVTIPTGLGGKYRVTLNTLWAQNATGFRQITLYKNGAGWLNSAELTAGAAYYVGQSITFTITLSAGDYIEMKVSQSSGGNLSLYKRESEMPFQLEFLGA